MSTHIEDIEWEKPNGEKMSKGEFIMHHTCLREWENLGVFPTHEDYVADGIYMEEVELRPRLLCDFKVTVNEDSTVNFEVTKSNETPQKLYYGSYLKSVTELNGELRRIGEAFVPA